MKPMKPMRPRKARKAKGFPSERLQPVTVRSKKQIMQQLKDVRGRFTSHFISLRKIPPVRYHRPTPEGMRKIKHTISHGVPVNTGYMMEFIYGEYEPVRVGGWKNDSRPVIFVYGDDSVRILEGINTNYLPDSYMIQMRKIMSRYPGVNQDTVYVLTKRIAPFAIKKGYRKYIRTSFRDVYIYVYENEFARELDKIAKMNAKGAKLMSVADQLNDKDVI